MRGGYIMNTQTIALKTFIFFTFLSWLFPIIILSNLTENTQLKCMKLLSVSSDLCH